jgi:hypothetical protein
MNSCLSIRRPVELPHFGVSIDGDWSENDEQ